VPTKDGMVRMEKPPLNGKLLRHVFAWVRWNGMGSVTGLSRRWSGVDDCVSMCPSLGPSFVFRKKRQSALAFCSQL